MKQTNLKACTTETSERGFGHEGAEYWLRRMYGLAHKRKKKRKRINRSVCEIVRLAGMETPGRLVYAPD